MKASEFRDLSVEELEVKARELAEAFFNLEGLSILGCYKGSTHPG